MTASINKEVLDKLIKQIEDEMNSWEGNLINYEYYRGMYDAYKSIRDTRIWE